MPMPKADLVWVCGKIISAQPERARDDARVDHFWIQLDCGLEESVQVSVNTLSARSAAVGVDSRLRLARLDLADDDPPQVGVGELDSCDYTDFESAGELDFGPCDREEVTRILVLSCRAASYLYAWGEPYRRAGPLGIHQIHSRRRSAAVENDVIGHDGGLRFYPSLNRSAKSTLVLFRFCGQ